MDRLLARVPAGDGTMPAVTSSQRSPVADPAGSRRAARGIVLDVVAVLVFVAAGRRSHGESSALAGSAVTAWPFLAGLAVGWAVVLIARLEPSSPKAGLAVLLPTVLLGMLLRRFVAGEGTAPTFVVVATCILAVFLVGRRVVAAWAGQRAARRRAAGRS
jgi:hypothetical protein